MSYHFMITMQKRYGQLFWLKTPMTGTPNTQKKEERMCVGLASRVCFLLHGQKTRRVKTKFQKHTTSGCTGIAHEILNFGHVFLSYQSYLSISRMLGLRDRDRDSKTDAFPSQLGGAP